MLQQSELFNCPQWKVPYLRVHQSEKDLGQSLYKSTQLVILQAAKQLGLTSPRLQGMALQEQVPSAQGTPGTAQRTQAGTNPAPRRAPQALAECK